MFIHHIGLTNILSFGPDSPELALGPLNVLIGPNGSGKSNFLEAIGLLKAIPSGLPQLLREGGGYGDWGWHGEPQASPLGLEVVMAGPRAPHSLHYTLRFDLLQNDLRVIEERLEDEHGPSKTRSHVYLHSHEGKTSVRDSSDGVDERGIPPNLPVLAQLRDPDRYPELTYIATQLQRISLYRLWSFGKNTPVRLPQKPDLPNNYLLEDMQNLGLVLNRLMRDYDVKQRLLKALGDLYEGVTDFHVNIEYGSVQVFLQEGKVAVPATRLSDGTLRYLCLLVILCDPNPPPLVCIEEPELGLHPDILPGLADLMREASERCQLIVTTHSDILVDALTDTPESIVVCEIHERQTTFRRLEKKQLAHWLQEYRLGELWTSGELGGNRW